MSESLPKTRAKTDAPNDARGRILQFPTTRRHAMAAKRPFSRHRVDTLRKLIEEARLSPCRNDQSSERAAELEAQTPAEVMRAFLCICCIGSHRTLKFFTRGSTEISFDEKWLLSLIVAGEMNDHASMKFLLSARVAPFLRRRARSLASRLATVV